VTYVDNTIAGNVHQRIDRNLPTKKTLKSGAFRPILAWIYPADSAKLNGSIGISAAGKVSWNAEFPPTENPMPTLEPRSCELSRRTDGAVVVRIPSNPNNGHTLPDAVFAFRLGDPQYAYWESQLRQQEVAK
jgi:hypothetical protein